MEVTLQSRRDHIHMRDDGGGAVHRAPLGLPERSDSMQKRFPNHASLFAAAHAHALQWLQAQVQWRAAGLLMVGLLVVPFVLADVCSRSTSDCFSLVAGRSSLTVLDYWQQPQQMTEEQVLLQRTLEEKERQKDEQGDADGERVAADAEIAAARSVGTTTGEGKVGAATVKESRAASAVALQGEGEKSDNYPGADADAESDAAVAAAVAAAAAIAKEDEEAAAAAAADDAAVLAVKAKPGIRVEGPRRASLTSAAASLSALRVDAGGNSGGGKQRAARRPRSTSDAGSSLPGTRDEVMQEDKRGVSGPVRVLQKEAAAAAADGEVVLSSTALSSDGARSTEGRMRRRKKAGADAAAAVVRPDADRALTSFSGDAVAGRPELATPGDGAVDATGAKRTKIAASSSGSRKRGSARSDQWQRNPSEVTESKETGGGGEKKSLRRRRGSRRRRALEGALLKPEEQGGPLLPVGTEGQSRTVSANKTAAAQEEEDSRGELTLWHKLCAVASSVPALAPLVQAAC